MATFLILLAIVAFVAAYYYIPRALSRGTAKVMYKNTNARGLDEVYTVTSFTAPVAPAALQRAIDTHLALPHNVPPLLGNLHVSEIRDDRLRIALGNKLRTEWTGVATFGPDTSGGTTGTYRVTHWTLHDGVIQSSNLTEGMTRVRDQITTAITDEGGAARTHLVPAAERK